MLEKRGRLAEIIFRNEENYYTVAVIENDDEMEQFIAVGNIPTAKSGMTFLFRGESARHTRRTVNSSRFSTVRKKFRKMKPASENF